MRGLFAGGDDVEGAVLEGGVDLGDLLVRPIVVIAPLVGAITRTQPGGKQARARNVVVETESLEMKIEQFVFLRVAHPAFGFRAVPPVRIVGLDKPIGTTCARLS